MVKKGKGEPVEATAHQDSEPVDVKPEESEEGETPEAEAAVKTPKTSELKVVILIKDDRIMLGVQSPTCDPVYKTLQGTIAEALQQVPALIAEANEKWAASPRYPKADLPTPPPSTTVARTPAAAPAQPKAQPSFF